ncbi:MAG: EAL domain-containing protein [Usitatibacter sp.]
MSRFGVAIALLLALVPVPASGAVPEARVSSLVVVTDDHYPPYLFRSDDGTLQGIVKDRWQLWSERNGIPVEVRGIDWSSAQESVRTANADVIDAIADTSGRVGQFEYSESHDDIEARLYFSRGLTGIVDASSVRGMLVAAKRDSACSEWLRAHGVTHFEFYPDSQALVKAAAAGEVRVFCMDALPARYFIYREGISGEFNESAPLYTAHLHWAVRSGRGSLRSFVERGFQRISEDELERIDAKWMGAALRSPLDVRFLYALAAIPVALLAFSGILLLWNRFLRLRVEERAQYFSTRDPLTELPARGLLYDRLTQAIAQAGRSASGVAVLFVDLDRFKAVNDSFGHAVGDRVLRETALRLQGLARSSDTVARISSDEFVVVLANLEKAGDAGTFARKVQGELTRPYQLDGTPVHCTASIGIAVHPGDGANAGTLIQNADIAMYRAKESGRNNFQFFLPEMHESVARRLHLEIALRGALARKEFLVHYQPKIDVGNGAITGFEALLRWRHPEFGQLSPSEFVPVLEDTDLIVPVGEWVLQTVCEQIRRWSGRGLAPRPVAVNLSARQFRLENLDAVVERIVTATGIDPSLLELELTETLLMHDPERAIRTLGNLVRFGVSLAVDDFGTGYSSLAYLKRFPIHSLKIDRAFISDATTNPDDAAITLAIINLGHSLGLKVVAEGVETEEQLAFLRANGCDQMQGFFFSPAIPADDAGAMLPREPAQVPEAISERSHSTN